MAILNERIKEMRTKRGITLLQLADSLGVKEATAQRYESGEIKTIKHETVVAIANALNCSPIYLMGWSGDPSIKDADAQEFTCYPYPVLGDVAAGFGSLAYEDYDGDVEHIPTEWLHGQSRDNFFVLRVKGDSMFPAYVEGDRVFVRKCDHVESGTIAVVIYDDEEATVKRVVHKDGDAIRLIPINPNIPPKEINGEDLDHFHVLGEVWRLIRVIK